MNDCERKSVQLIEELSNAKGVSGFEDEVLLVGRKYGEAFADIEEDTVRNLFLKRKGNTGGKPVVMIDGHSDEVGFIVQAIKANGTLAFLPVGGWVDANVGASKVRIRNTEGKYISGVIGSKPPHFMSEAERKLPADMTSMFIDIGASSRAEVVNDFKIEMGAPVVPDVTFEYNESNKIMLGKAFDCRMGCAAVVGTLQGLADASLAVDVVGTFSSQEEVGCRGAKVSAQRVKPDVAIVFEGTPADDTIKLDFDPQSVLKAGPQIRIIDKSMISNPRLLQFSKKIANEQSIPYQMAVRAGGSTNGSAIHLTEKGIPVLVLGIPVRYIHTHHCYAALEDYQSSVALAVEVIKRLNADVISKF